MTWQPIETAPQETVVLIFEDGEISTAELSYGEWSYSSGGCYNPLDDFYGDYLSPTHWMPLPDARP